MLFVENEVPVHDFDYSFDEVVDALRYFKGPYGTIGSHAYEVSFSQCSCNRDHQIQLARRRKRDATLKVRAVRFSLISLCFN